MALARPLSPIRDSEHAPALSVVQYVLTVPPSKADVQAAKKAWLAFQDRWLRTYGTRTATPTQLYDLADGLFHRSGSQARRTGNINKFGKFLGVRVWSDTEVHGWTIRRSRAGYYLHAV